MSKSSVFCACCAVVALVVCGMRAEAAQPSAAKMSQMGLSGAQVVSDSVAMEVRGFGYRGGRNRVTIWGESTVEVKVRIWPYAEVKVESEHGYHSTTGGSQSGQSYAAVGLEAPILFNHGVDNNVEALNSGNSSTVAVLWATGSSSVKVGSSHRSRRW
jgi:hypothetical protein